MRCVVGVDPSVSNSAPANEAAILQLQPIILLSASVQTPTCLKFKATDLMWAATSSTIPGPYAGLYGQFSATATGTASTGALNYMVTVTVGFRGRK